MPRWRTTLFGLIDSCLGASYGLSILGPRQSSTSNDELYDMLKLHTSNCSVSIEEMLADRGHPLEISHQSNCKNLYVQVHTHTMQCMGQEAEGGHSHTIVKDVKTTTIRGIEIDRNRSGVHNSPTPKSNRSILLLVRC